MTGREIPMALITPTRRHFLGTLGASIAAPAVVTAQSTERKRIYMVLFRGETEVEQGFRAYVQERGLPFDIIVRNIDRNRANLPKFVEEIRGTRPHLVYAWGTTVALGLVGTQDATDRSTFIPDTIPCVFALVADPVGARLASRMGDGTGRNVTGVSHIVPLPSQINAISAYRPFSRIGMIYNPLEENSVLNVRAMEALAQQRGYALTVEKATMTAANQPDPAAVPALVDKVADAGAQFFYIGPDTFVGDQRHAITAQALQRRLPTFTATELEVRTSDTLFGLVSRYDNVGRFAAYKAEQILMQNRYAGDLPVETLQRFSYIVNMSVARKLQLYPPMSVLRFAEVIGV